MRKMLLLLLGCAMSIFSYAEETEVPLSPDADEPDIWDTPHKAPARMPKVSYEDQNLFIVSPYAVFDATVIIRDVAGNIIYNVVTALPASSYVIVLPADVCAQKYTIQLQYNGQSLIGWF